jgi:hypothetical protein
MYFYPLAALLIGGMIAFALSFGGGAALSDDDILALGWRMEGPALRNLNVSPGTEVRYIDEEGGFVRLSAFTPFDVGPGSVGVFASLGADYERAFAGREIEISLRVRAADRNGLEAFDTAYFPIEAPASDWQVFRLSPDWQDLSFTFSPDIVAAPPNVDLLSIWPGKAGESLAMDLAQIRIEVVGEGSLP